MPVFHCCRGDVSNLAIDKPNSFALADDFGRNWICWQSSNINDNSSDIDEIHRALELVFKHGFWDEGSVLTSLVCEIDELPLRLVQNDEPIEMRD